MKTRGALEAAQCQIFAGAHMRAEVITVEKCEVKQLLPQSEQDCSSVMGDGGGFRGSSGAG